MDTLWNGQQRGVHSTTWFMFVSLKMHRFRVKYAK